MSCTLADLARPGEYFVRDTGAGEWMAMRVLRPGDVQERVRAISVDVLSMRAHHPMVLTVPYARRAFSVCSVDLIIPDYLCSVVLLYGHFCPIQQTARFFELANENDPHLFQALHAYNARHNLPTAAAAGVYSTDEGDAHD